MKTSFSIKGLFIFGVACVFLSLLLIGGASLVNLRAAMALTDEIAEDTLTELHLTVALELGLLRSAMPVNDYIIHADPAEQENHRRLSGIVDGHLHKLFSVPTLSPGQRRVLVEARQEWEQAVALGNSIMQATEPASVPGIAEQMERFDDMIDAAANHLGQVHDIIDGKIAARHEELHDIEYYASNLILYLFAAGLLVAVTGAFVLARSLFPSLNMLSAGMRRFTGGDYGYRIDKPLPVELHGLAEGFNIMAAKLEETYRQLEEKSTRDPLTGCLNRRKFNLDFRIEISRSRRLENDMSLLVIDLDHFKDINDRHGHHAGDRVLQKAVAEMKGQLRDYDTLYRYGGEEFTVLMPNTDATAAHIVSERIRNAVGNTRIRIDNENFLTITISIGIATLPGDAETEHGLMELADHALYEAKNLGRNRVCHFRDCP